MDARLVAPGLYARLRRFAKDHGKKLWWLHTVYALGLGVFVATLAQKGIDHARYLVVSLVAVWIALVFFFRYFGTGASQDVAVAWAAKRLRFVALTYVLKNLYQGMLFFLLPFYVKSATFGGSTQYAVIVLVALALLSALDMVFDRVLMRFRGPASAFYALTLFAVLNVAIPALFPNIRTLFALLSAAVLATLGVFALHLPIRALARPSTWVLLVASVLGATVIVYAGRRFVPPVPMYVVSAAVGPSLLDDGRLASEVTSIHASVIERMVAITEVSLPGGQGDKLVHVWKKGDTEVYRAADVALSEKQQGQVVRLRSTLAPERLPTSLTGPWTVNVETEDGQLVGRASFEVTE